ncbi:MAG: helix-turn-helix domain-containing protein [Solirubrobacteraceae bacterium]
MTSLTSTDLAEIAAVARATRARIAASAVERVLAELPIDHATRRNLEAGTLAAVDAFLATLAEPDGTVDTALFRAHGRAQCAAGRSITELLSLYRLGGLAMWEHVEEMPASDRLTGAQALALGGRLLGLVEQLSAAAVDGFLEAGAELRRRDRARRGRLHSLLLSEPPETREAIEAAAAHAGWAVPECVRVAVAALPIEADAADQERSPARVLTGPHPRGRIVLVVGEQTEAEAAGQPAAQSAEALLERAALAHGATGPLAIGPSVPLAEAARSAHRAGHLLDEVERGAVTAAPIVRTDDHELPLLLAAAPELVAALVERRLAPVAGLAPAKREQTLETLAAWLADPHRPQAIADRLGMHVQSVRYRLARLRELFGDDLDDPEARFELQVALHASGKR